MLLPQLRTTVLLTLQKTATAVVQSVAQCGAVTTVFWDLDFGLPHQLEEQSRVAKKAFRKRVLILIQTIHDTVQLETDDEKKGSVGILTYSMNEKINNINVTASNTTHPFLP